MKLVVTGTPGAYLRITSRSAMKHWSRAFELNRLKSRRWAWLLTLTATRGASISSHSPYF
ncbi:hypothetical protein ABIB51_002274 [Arthrobacter sp. UYCu712]